MPSPLGHLIARRTPVGATATAIACSVGTLQVAGCRSVHGPKGKVPAVGSISACALRDACRVLLIRCPVRIARSSSVVVKVRQGTVRSFTPVVIAPSLAPNGHGRCQVAVAIAQAPCRRTASSPHASFTTSGTTSANEAEGRPDGVAAAVTLNHSMAIAAAGRVA